MGPLPPSPFRSLPHFHSSNSMSFLLSLEKTDKFKKANKLEYFLKTIRAQETHIDTKTIKHTWKPQYTNKRLVMKKYNIKKNPTKIH